MIQWPRLTFIRRFTRLWRIFKGRCPYCNKGLKWEQRSNENWTKLCPDLHYGVENLGNGRVMIYDREGDPIELLFDRNFKLLKNEDDE